VGRYVCAAELAAKGLSLKALMRFGYSESLLKALFS
jgi:hypothetical protein